MKTQLFRLTEENFDETIEVVLLLITDVNLTYAAAERICQYACARTHSIALYGKLCSQLSHSHQGSKFGFRQVFLAACQEELEGSEAASKVGDI